MRDSLDKLESIYRREANQRARLVCGSHIFKAFGFGVLFAPGALLGAMFVPIFGLLLALAVLFVALIFARLKRSFLVLVAGMSGAIVVLIALSALGTVLGMASTPVLYTLLATCVASDLTALVVLGGAIIGQHEAGFRQQRAA